MNRTIEISVKERIAWQTNNVEYICGNNDFVVNFVFDREWEGVEPKIARFIHGEHYTDVVFAGKQCPVPHITDATKMVVGVYTSNLWTTTGANVLCKKSILCGDGVPADPHPDIYAQIMEMLKERAATAKISEVTLLASAWEGEENLYSQVVAIEGVTENSQVDITPNVEQLVIFYEKDLTFVTENDGGVVTVYAIGQKPANDYTIQVTITEVYV